MMSTDTTTTDTTTTGTATTGATTDTTTTGTSGGSPKLPPEFADLEPWAAIWVLPTLEERLQLRLATPMDELQAFRDAVYARAEEAMDYLDGFDVDDLPEAADNLMHLLYALSCAGVATDVFACQRDPNSGVTWIHEITEPPF